MRLVLAMVLCLLAGRALADGCPSSDGFADPDEALTHFGAALRGKGPIVVLSVGAVSPAEQEQSAKISLAARTVEAMRAALPGREIRLELIGGRGLSAGDMLPLLADGLARHKPSLVIWQTGTVEAVRGLRTDELADALADGAGKIQEAGADLILVDPQWSRFLRANADVDPYEEVLRQAAALPGVVLFRRFDLMHEWVDDGAIDLERVGRAEREQAIRRLHDCLGDTLARFALAGAAQSAE